MSSVASTSSRGTPAVTAGAVTGASTGTPLSTSSSSSSLAGQAKTASGNKPKPGSAAPAPLTRPVSGASDVSTSSVGGSGDELPLQKLVKKLGTLRRALRKEAEIRQELETKLRALVTHSLQT